MAVRCARQMDEELVQTYKRYIEKRYIEGRCRANTIEEALELPEKFTLTLARNCFVVSKWMSKDIIVL